jgi:hypothetical protein
MDLAWNAVVFLFIFVILPGFSYLVASFIARRWKKLQSFSWQTFFWVLFILNLLDLLTTKMAIARGKEESNFIPKLILSYGEHWFILHKIVVGTILSFAVARLAIKKPLVMLTIIIVFCFAVAWNAALILF